MLFIKEEVWDRYAEQIAKENIADEDPDSLDLLSADEYRRRPTL